MDNLLEVALANTGRSNVVSENHDMNSINWVAGLTDPGEMIGCGMYQQLRRLTNESDRDYLRRITPLVNQLPVDIQNRIRGVAIRRASLTVTASGRISVMVAGEPAWHGLGVNVREAVNSQQAIEYSGLNWSTDKAQLLYINPATGEPATVPDKFAITRSDTGSVLGVVGKQYKPFQNSEAFAFLDSVLAQFGAKYETAGAIYGGSKVWMMVHLPKQSFTVNGSGDRVEPYAIFTNSHDGTSAARCFPTTQRVVCANTFRLAQSDADKGLTIRHTGNLKQRVEAAQKVLDIAVHQVEHYKENAEHLVHYKLNNMNYVNRVLDAVCQVTEADSATGADALTRSLDITHAQREIKRAELQAEIDRRENLLEDVLTRYEQSRNGVNGMRGSAWSSFNAVTESADHGKLGGRYNGEHKASRRFESVINGDADTIKQTAYEIVLEMTKNN